MRPSYGVAALAVVLVIGALLLFTPPREVEPAPPAAPPLPAIALEPRGPGALDDEVERARLLDEVEDREAEDYGKAEAARRRNYREQLLEQRPGSPD